MILDRDSSIIEEQIQCGLLGSLRGVPKGNESGPGWDVVETHRAGSEA